VRQRKPDLDPRADLASVAPENVAKLVPIVRECKRRGFTAREVGEKFAADWSKQARRDESIGIRDKLLIEQDLRAAFGALSEIILAIYGERLKFTLTGDMES
jgi:hypothetical protein